MKRTANNKAENRKLVARLSLFGLALSCIPSSSQAVTLATETFEGILPEKDSGKKSFRFSFVLGNHRRYASRYIPERRTLQIRVTPAKGEEFKPVEFYDGRFIHRAIVKESDGEVILDLQLKNLPISWVITHQEEPWRILVDLWTDSKPTSESNAQWTWSEFFSDSTNLAQSSSVISNQPSTRNGSSQGGFAAVDVPDLINDVSQADPAPTDNSESPIVQNTEASKSETSPRSTSAIEESKTSLPKSENMNPKLRRFLKTREQGNVAVGEASDEILIASNLFWTGQHLEAVNEFRKIAALNQRLLLGNPEALWYAGESALQSNQNDVARDYFQTLKKNSSDSVYSHYADLRLANLDEVENQSSDAPSKTYQSLIDANGAPWIVKSIAAIRLTALKGKAAPPSAQLLPIFEACTDEPLLINEIKRDCAYSKLNYDLATDDLLASQSTIREFERQWPNDERIANNKADLQKRIQAFADTIKSPEDHASWNSFERKSNDQWLSFTNTRSDLLRMRAIGWERSGNTKVALDFYDRSYALETSPKIKMEILARTALLATNQGEQERANQALRSLQSIPERTTSGLGLQDYADVKTLALPPVSNRLAVALIADDIFKGFHAENDMRTMVTLSETLEGSREADVLFDKLLSIPSKSESEAQMKEESLMNYAETLRNQGRLVKSAEVYLAVANLDNGKNRAEAAYKAGVVYFRAGLLEKAESSWNIAANDLANSKYSALATERLNRIR